MLDISSGVITPDSISGLSGPAPEEAGRVPVPVCGVCSAAPWSALSNRDAKLLIGKFDEPVPLSLDGGNTEFCR